MNIKHLEVLRAIETLEKAGAKKMVVEGNIITLTLKVEP